MLKYKCPNCKNKNYDIIENMSPKYKCKKCNIIWEYVIKTHFDSYIYLKCPKCNKSDITIIYDKLTLFICNDCLCNWKNIII